LQKKYLCRKGTALSSALAKSIEQLKSDLQLKHGMKLIDPQNLKSSSGVGTGWSALDSFVASGGFPCGEISLVEAPEGLGALTLWLEAAALLTQNNSRVAWLNSALDDREPFELHPPAALHRGVDLQKLFLVNLPASQKRLWVLQELLNSKLFSLVGCDLGEVRIPLRECRSLLTQARRSGAAVVFFDRAPTASSAKKAFPSPARSIASLVLKFESSGVEIIRAAHRPVPQHLQRRDRHVDFITGSESRPALGDSQNGNRAFALDPSFILSAGRSNTGIGD
jgi:hypothetical protein